MKLDVDVIVNLLIAMLIFAVLNKLVLEGLLEKLPTIGGDFELDSDFEIEE